MVRRICARVAWDSRSGWRRSPICRVCRRVPQGDWITKDSSRSAIAGNETTSHSSWTLAPAHLPLWERSFVESTPAMSRELRRFSVTRRTAKTPPDSVAVEPVRSQPFSAGNSWEQGKIQGIYGLSGLLWAVQVSGLAIPRQFILAPCVAPFIKNRELTGNLPYI